MLSARLGFWWCFVRSWGWDDYFLIIVLPCRLIQVLQIQGEAVKNLKPNLVELSRFFLNRFDGINLVFINFFWFIYLILTILGRKMKLKHKLKSFEMKGFLISKSFSLRLKSSNINKVPNQSPEHYPPKKNMLRGVIWHLFFWRFDPKWKTIWD